MKKNVVFTRRYWGIKFIFTINVPALGTAQPLEANIYTIPEGLWSTTFPYSLQKAHPQYNNDNDDNYWPPILWHFPHWNMWSMSPLLNLNRLWLLWWKAVWWKWHCMALEGRPTTQASYNFLQTFLLSCDNVMTSLSHRAGPQEALQSPVPAQPSSQAGEWKSLQRSLVSGCVGSPPAVQSSQLRSQTLWSWDSLPCGSRLQSLTQDVWPW